MDGEDEVITVAKRDIQPGEELTDDYRTFEAHLSTRSTFGQAGVSGPLSGRDTMQRTAHIVRFSRKANS